MPSRGPVTGVYLVVTCIAYICLGSSCAAEQPMPKVLPKGKEAGNTADAAGSNRATAIREALGLFKEWTLVSVQSRFAGGIFTEEEIDSLRKAADVAKAVLRKAGIQKGLTDAARQAADQFRAESITVYVTDGPTISQIKGRLGKEDATETVEYRDPTASQTMLTESLTWHRYGWFLVGCVSGQVRVMKVDCTKLPATLKRPERVIPRVLRPAFA